MSIRVTLSRLAAVQAVTIMIVCLSADPAAAYVGPGAGLTLIGSVVAVVAAVLIALVGLVLFPIRLLMKKMKAAKAQQSTGEA